MTHECALADFKTLKYSTAREYEATDGEERHLEWPAEEPFSAKEWVKFWLPGCSL